MSSSDDGGSGQRGRPKKDPEDRRTISHGLYLNQKEKQELKKRAEAAGLSVNEYLRRSALGGEPIQAKSDQKTRRELRWIGNNLNQLARKANRGELPEVAEAVEDGIEELREALDRIE
jgi:hypothetical protein